MGAYHPGAIFLIDRKRIEATGADVADVRHVIDVPGIGRLDDRLEDAGANVALLRVVADPDAGLSTDSLADFISIGSHGFDVHAPVLVVIAIAEIWAGGEELGDVA